MADIDPRTAAADVLTTAIMHGVVSKQTMAEAFPDKVDHIRGLFTYIMAEQERLRIHIERSIGILRGERVELPEADLPSGGE